MAACDMDGTGIGKGFGGAVAGGFGGGVVLRRWPGTLLEMACLVVC
jgi:hypothetical protein